MVRESKRYWISARRGLRAASLTGCFHKRRAVFPMKEIPLTQGKFAIVDDEDFERVNQFKWHAIWDRFNWYACTYKQELNGEKKQTRMHQFLIPGRGLLDHRNGNGLDNQKHNLRPATNAQNLRSRKKSLGTSSRFKGVCRVKNKWLSKICFQYHDFFLGYYDREEDAAISYNHAALAFFGEFARLNSV